MGTWDSSAGNQVSDTGSTEPLVYSFDTASAKLFKLKDKKLSCTSMFVYVWLYISKLGMEMSSGFVKVVSSIIVL